MQLMVLREFYSAPGWYWGPLGRREQLIHCVFLSLPIHRYWLLECNVASQYRVPSKACIVLEKLTAHSCFYRIIKYFELCRLPSIPDVSEKFWYICDGSRVIYLQCRIQVLLKYLEHWLPYLVFWSILYRSKEASTVWWLKASYLAAARKIISSPACLPALTIWRNPMLKRFYFWLQSQLMFVLPYLICASKFRRFAGFVWKTREDLQLSDFR